MGPGPAHPDRVPPGRVLWVDTAKGFAILLVVLYHSTLFLSYIGLASFWELLNPLLDTFRMPLFFFTAGLFAARTIALPLNRMVRKRAWPLLWTYLVWCTVFALVTAVIPWAWTGAARPSLTELLTILWNPNASLWFLYALALYSLIAWCLRALPVWLQLAPAALLSALFGSGLLSLGDVTLDKMCTYLVFFLLSLHTAALARSANERVPHGLGWLLLPVFAAAAAAIGWADLDRIPGVNLLLSVLAIATGVLVAQSLARAPALFGWLASLGRRTLPVYVLHYYPIFLVAAGLFALAPDAASSPVAALGPVLPPALTAIAVLLALAAHLALRHLPWLWTPPFPTPAHVSSTESDRAS